MSRIQVLAAAALVALLPVTAVALVGALDKFKVGAAEKSQLLGVLGPMQGQIVEKK